MKDLGRPSMRAANDGASTLEFLARSPSGKLTDCRRSRFCAFTVKGADRAGSVPVGKHFTRVSIVKLLERGKRIEDIGMPDRKREPVPS